MTSTSIRQVQDWRFVLGLVDQRPAILVCDPDDASGRPKYLVVLKRADDRTVNIRDLLFAGHAIEGAELLRLHRLIVDREAA